MDRQANNNGTDATTASAAKEVTTAAAEEEKKKKEELMPRCVACGIAMGYSNPRQYCRKTYCPNMPLDYDDVEDEK